MNRQQRSLTHLCSNITHIYFKSHVFRQLYPDEWSLYSIAIGEHVTSECCNWTNRIKHFSGPCNKKSYLPWPRKYHSCIRFHRTFCEQTAWLLYILFIINIKFSRFWQLGSCFFPTAAHSVSSAVFHMHFVQRNVFFTTAKWRDWLMFSRAHRADATNN